MFSIEYYFKWFTNILSYSEYGLKIAILKITCFSHSLTSLQRHQPQLFAALLADPHGQLPSWNVALLAAQKQLLEGNAFLDANYQVKENCHVRFVQLPGTTTTPLNTADDGGSSTGPHLQHQQQTTSVFPNHEQVGRFVQVKGNVVRMTQAKLLECRREYRCNKCTTMRLVEAAYEKMYVIEAPRGCRGSASSAAEGGGAGCRGTMYPLSAQPAPEHCMDFQEIRIQVGVGASNV